MRLRLVALSIAAMLSLASLAHATRDPAYEANLDAELVAIDASLVPTFRQATKDLDDEHFVDAAAGFEAIHKAAPDFTPATRRLCRAYIEKGEGERGMALCREAVAKARNADNLTMLALALFATSTPQDAAESMRVVNEAVAKEPNNVDANTTSCVIARARHELDPFRACTRNLLRLKPDEWATHLFAAQVAGNDGNFREARAELETAHRLGLNDDEYKSELADLDAANPWYMRVFDVAKWVPIGWFGLILAISLMGGVVSKPLRVQAERARKKPAGKTTFKAPEGLGVFLRVTTITYLSSGILWILLFAATTGVVGWGAYRTQTIAWKIVATLAFLTVYLGLSVIGGLRPPEDARADEPLDLEEEPEWKKLLGKMKKRLGVAAVPTKLSLVAGKEFAVLRDGSIGARLRGESLTGILIGREAFDEMDERTFQARLAQAVVAASGDDDIAKTARFETVLALARAGHDEGGSSGLFSPAYWIVRLMGIAARGVLAAARECREIIGDQAAAKHYGRDALLEGLDATGYVNKERKKFVDALAEGAVEDGEGEPRSLWALFEDAEKAKRKLEGTEEEEEEETEEEDAHAHEDEDEDEDDEK